MKKLLLAFLTPFVVYLGWADGWNSIVATSVDVSSFTKSGNYTNKDGIHVLLSGASSVKYVLLSSTGVVVRQSTLENNGANFPSVAGNNDGVFAVYLMGSAIKVKRTTDAGANWSSVDDITFGDSYCSGMDAVGDDRGLHVAYATRPSSTGPWETYYQRYVAESGWTGYKNVTDYNLNEVGGFPSVSVSANKVHISYNTGQASEPTSNSGDAKTRDYNFTSQSWEDPQLVYGYPSGYSMGERIYSDGTYLHMFYYKLVEGMGQYHSDTYHTKRTLGGSS